MTDRISSPYDAELLAARIMTELGYEDVHLTPAVSDGGVDVQSRTGVAHVKLHMKTTGRPDLQRLCGARALRVEQDMLFFCFMGYTTKAIEYADHVGMALFRYQLDGSYFAVNDVASKIASRKRQLPTTESGWTATPRAANAGLRRQYSARTWILLVVFCWPLALLLYCIRSPQQATEFVRLVRDVVVQFPKITAAITLAIGIAIAVGTTVNGKYPQSIPGAVLIVVSSVAMVGLLVREHIATSDDCDRLGLSGSGHAPRFPWSRDNDL
ncbi:restriction endonuclease [Nocardia brasiliensis]|uniref:restriction endonuclease n=1 Tax=Nocardia brasiliensis TaxID=37326 RepID=UPI002454A3C9|nr:restriction endonuclease [Nocardia brasiliensis]